MEVLNTTSLCEALLCCNNNKNYKVIVVFEKTANAMAFIDELLGIHTKVPIPGIDKIYIGSFDSRINFKNGSRIELVVLTDTSIRGRRCHHILYEEDVDSPTMRDIVRHMLVPYRLNNDNSINPGIAQDVLKNVGDMWYCKRHKEEEQQSQELDEFLGAFFINE